MADTQTNLWIKSLDAFEALPHPVKIDSVHLGDGSLALMAGPCSIESEKLCLSVAEQLTRVCADLGIPYIFKSSFDKANRTSSKSFRGHGLNAGLKILQMVKDQFGIPVLTDVHEACQVKAVSEVVDVLQIPAFLCRQTDLLVECGRSGKAVNIKKGQFLPPEDMKYAAEKVIDSGDSGVILTERGALFGYRDLVVDMRNLVIMREMGYPVVFDATHSVQQMGAAGGSSGGRPGFIPAQVRAATAVGIDALFVETHPDPSKALSDGSTMVPLAHMKNLLTMALECHAVHRTSTV